MPVAIPDSSVLIHLALIGRLDLLRMLYDEVAIPSAVQREVVEEGKGRAGAREVQHAIDEGWIDVRPVRDHRLVRLLKRELDDGESEALALALEHEDAWLLVDESHARSVAATYGVQRKGVIGILIQAKARGKIDALRPALDRLREDGTFWISEPLYEEALQSVGEHTS